MAINTYSTLQTAIANWLDRDDLTNRITEFIALCEARFGRKLRIRLMETTTTASTAAGTRSYALPTSYLSGRVFSLNTTPITPLEYLTPEMMDRLWAGSISGKPLTYTIVGDNYHLGPAPDAVYTIEIIYYKQVDALSDAAPSNTMLTNNPDVYLYGALLEAAPFLQNHPDIPVWKGAYDDAIDNIQKADTLDRHSGSVLRIINTSGNP